MCQRKKAKQKHRNSASVGVDSRTVVDSRDWKDANSGLARIVWYAFDYRVPRVVLVRNNARQQCLCLALSARKCSVVIQVERRESKRVPVQDHRNRMKQSREKSRNRETRPPWPDRERIGSDWSRLSVVRSFACSLAAAPCFRGFYCRTHTDIIAGRPEGVRNTKEQKQ